MSYIPTNWADNDEVTSAKLNHLESGVTAVGYEPTTWAAGDVVTAEKLNHLEQGVADSVDVMANYANRSLTEFAFTEDMQVNGELSIGSNYYTLDFAGCTLLERFTGTEFVNQRILPHVFDRTSSLTRIDFPNAQDIGGTSDSIGLDSGMKEVSFKNAKTIGNGALCIMSALEHVYIPSVTQLGSSIQGCSKLKHVYIGANCTSINSSCFAGSGGSGTGVGLIIDCGFAEGAVSGAPWGASNATINYNVPDPGSIDAMIEGES